MLITAVFDKFLIFAAMQPFTIIRFTIYGMQLQEPMALVTNWMITLLSVYFFIRLYRSNAESGQYFKRFYLLLAISTFLGGLGHLFFQYTGIYGKFPSWILATLAGLQIGQGILVYWRDRPSYNFFFHFLWIKSFALLALSLVFQKFVFIAIDSIFTYLIYCGYIAWKLQKERFSEMKYFIFGVLILLPSAFIFLLNLNVHVFLNRDDLSHLLILVTITFFYRSIKRLSYRESLLTAS